MDVAINLRLGTIVVMSLQPLTCYDFEFCHKSSKALLASRDSRIPGKIRISWVKLERERRRTKFEEFIFFEWEEALLSV